MQTCFVAQPFDAAEFDKRYKDIYEPAINAAGLKPYRVDKDPSASIPIEKITEQISQATAVFVDISLDNPNVFFEYGYALAKNKECCVICAEHKRTKLPFNIQHRTTIFYKNESMSDFENLRKNITERLLSIIEINSIPETVEKNINKIIAENESDRINEGEITAIAAIMENGDFSNNISLYTYLSQMERWGYTNTGAKILLMGHQRREFIKTSKSLDRDGDEYTVISLTPIAENWIYENSNNFKMKGTTKTSSNSSSSERMRSTIDDDIPF